MKKEKTSEIYWNYPKKFDTAIQSETAINGWGIYCISRKFRNKETILYIGLTFNQTFKERLKSHSKNWLDLYRGEKIVRLGEFIRPRTISQELIKDAESCLIYELKPIHNTDKINSYTYTDSYIILSSGYRGLIPKQISMNNH